MSAIILIDQIMKPEKTFNLKVCEIYIQIDEQNKN